MAVAQTNKIKNGTDQPKKFGSKFEIEGRVRGTPRYDKIKRAGMQILIIRQVMEKSDESNVSMAI